MDALPSAARVVIIGGGIAGCSTAYHLTKLGVRDVVVLEQGRLTCGTTWHAAGLVGALRGNRTMTQMSLYGTQLYATLEAETGQATGWKRCGAVTVARTPERMILLKRMVASARSFGVEATLITPKEAGERYPLMRTDDLQGAVWLPGDGKANPADLTQALAKGARAGGARFFEQTRVSGVKIHNGHVAGVMTDKGDIACEAMVICAGQWSRDFGASIGVNVPLHSAEHFYIVTKRIEGVTPDTPIMRDPDGCIYYKEEVGGLLMGGFELEAKPWGMNGIPDKFEFQLLPDDWEQFEPLMSAALHRTPCLEKAEIRQFVNGPESFTPDGQFILGEAPELAGCFVGAGFNSAGIANSGGAGRALAHWVVNGVPPHDLGECDVRRFAGWSQNREWLKARVVESLGLHYVMRWPREELLSGRDLRRSPLYDRLKAKGAVFGAKLGWERANYFKPVDGKTPGYTFGKPGWLDWMREEQRAVRQAVAVFDQTSFAKLLVQGKDALAFLQHLCSNQMDVPVGDMVYTAVLNPRGGYESDLTVLRLAAESFLVITGSAQARRDLHWFTLHVGDRNVTLADVTSAYSVISVMGPQAPALLAKVSPADLSDAAFPLGRTREIDLGQARVRAARMAYVGGVGFEMYVPTEFVPHVYERLMEHKPKDAGYFTLDALRIEAGRRAFGAELGPDETPLQAGLMHAVKLDKGDFIGREAVVAERAKGPAKRLVLFVCDDPETMLWGGEIILRDGKPVGEITSAGFSDRAGACVCMGYVRGGGTMSREAVLASRYEFDVAGAIVPARALAKPYFVG